MNALELLAISKRRGTGPRAVEVLFDVSLVLAPGEVVLLEGPSGSGKTTLLALAAGLLVPDVGEVLVAGRLLDARDAGACRTRRRCEIGFVFQRPSLLPNLTVRENVLLGAALAGHPREASAREADALLLALDMARLAQRRPGELSGGEEQRAAVARALVHRPALVLADEPTGNLDSGAGRAVAASLVALAQERGTGVLIATHDNRLAQFASRRLRLSDGRLDSEKGG